MGFTKYLNILVLISTVCLSVLTIIAGGLALKYYNLYDSYFWLIENPLDEVFMALMGCLICLSLLSDAYSFYVSDRLAFYFNKLTDSKKNSRQSVGTIQVKIFKGVILLFCLVTLILAFYDFVTIDPLFHARGILKSLQKYKSEMSIKEAIDKLQMNYKCCGHLSYTNWTDLDVEMESGPNDGENENLRYIPFSCCNSSSMRPCLHELVELDHGSINYEFSTDLAVYQEGCSVVMKHIFKSTILPLLCIFGAIFVLECLALIFFFCL